MTRDQRMGSGSSRNNRNERRIVVRGVKRAKPDLRRLSRVLIAFAIAEAEAEAERQAKAQQESPEDKPRSADEV